MTEEVQAAILGERERIAKWHDRQAEMLEAAQEQIEKEGGKIDRRSLAELHRSFAAAIRAGAE
jgi:hypothetical protein